MRCSDATAVHADSDSYQAVIQPGWDIQCSAMAAASRPCRGLSSHIRANCRKDEFFLYAAPAGDVVCQKKQRAGDM